MKLSSNPLIEDGLSAIRSLTKEANETEPKLTLLEQSLADRSLPERPKNDRSLTADERKAILDAYSAYANDEARCSGMRKRLSFIHSEIKHWQERIAIASRSNVS
jgi:hypothetical protein